MSDGMYQAMGIGDDDETEKRMSDGISHGLEESRKRDRKELLKRPSKKYPIYNTPQCCITTATLPCTKGATPLELPDMVVGSAGRDITNGMAQELHLTIEENRKLRSVMMKLLGEALILYSVKMSLDYPNDSEEPEVFQEARELVFRK